METRRIHIMGASGAGVTTLGRALADALAIPHHDTDDYFWQPTIPPYQKKREIADRLRLMREMFLGRADWVLSGSLEGWGGPIVPDFDLVVLLYTAKEIRLRRLRAREARPLGADAVATGGWRHQKPKTSLKWASHYDTATARGRTFQKHQAWLAALPRPGAASRWRGAAAQTGRGRRRGDYACKINARSRDLMMPTTVSLTGVGTPSGLPSRGIDPLMASTSQRRPAL
jgi:adenylate kinase family enzyme